MKKALVVTALVLVISLSLIAGTLAMYVVEIDNLAEGSVVAKEFILLEGATDTFEENVKIAPGETVEWQFSVKNHDGTAVSETAMNLEFAITLSDAGSKEAIEPLVVTVKDGENIVETASVEGIITFSDEFALDDTGQEKTYTVAIDWPGDGENDIDYAGAGYGTALKVSVTGTQK